MPYIRPTDVELITPTQWSVYPLNLRVTDAIAIAAVEKWSCKTAQFAVIASCNEQPPARKIPCNNTLGLMSFGATYPYGWIQFAPERKPIGYCLAREGQTGNTAAVFLAFRCPSDTLHRMMMRIQTHGWAEGGPDQWATRYAIGWVGDPAQESTAIAGFKAQAKVVLAAWPKQVDGWRDAGASKP